MARKHEDLPAVLFTHLFAAEDPNRCYLMATCGHDNRVKLWMFEVSRKLQIGLPDGRYVTDLAGILLII